jgi:hypothetical protein
MKERRNKMKRMKVSNDKCNERKKKRNRRRD